MAQRSATINCQHVQIQEKHGMTSRELREEQQKDEDLQLLEIEPLGLVG